MLHPEELNVALWINRLVRIPILTGKRDELNSPNYYASQSLMLIE